MFKLTGKIISTFITLGFIVLISGYFIYRSFTDNGNSGNEKSSDKYFTVVKVVDGDTFELSDKSKVRLLGIDTPEVYDSDKLERDAETSGQDIKTIEKLGKIASDYVRGIAEGKRVRLERDTKNDDKDKYGRLLRYVYLEDGTCINAKILKDGYAQVYDRYEITKIDEFRKLQKEARENKRGLWGPVEGLEQLN